MSKIDRVDVRVFDVPLAEVLTDAKHGDHTHFELVTVTVSTADGGGWHRVHLYRGQGRAGHCRDDRT